MSNFRLWPVPSGRLLIAILLALGAIVAPTTANAHRGDTSKTRSSVQAFASPDVETGTSTLSRSDRGVVARCPNERNCATPRSDVVVGRVQPARPVHTSGVWR